MGNQTGTDSPLAAVAGAADPQVTDAFDLLNDETRLAILLALWEAYDPQDTDNTVAFSELYDRLGARDSGNFTYHLDRLVGHFIERTDDGYRLRHAGLKIIQATIAGVGLEERTLPPTEIDMSCHRCGAPVEISYEDEYLYHHCTACEGNIGPAVAEESPAGTLMMFDFAPAGLTDRVPGEVFVAGTIKSLRDFGLLIRGICPECSGPIEESVHICESHEAPPGEVCSTCGTGDEVRVSYVCSVCKYGDSYPVHAAIYDHPAVIAFCYKHGIETTYALDEPAACGALWDHLLNREYSLVSENPVRIRIRVPAERATLHLTLDEHLTVIDIAEKARDPQRRSAQERPASAPGDGDDGSRTTTRQGRLDVAVLPDNEDCLKYLRRRRWPDGVTCPHCDSADTIRKGTTSKDAQRYRCRTCDSIFNDLTGTLFGGHRLSVPEMFYVVREMHELPTTQLARQLDRSYKSVLGFVHDAQQSDDWTPEAVSSAALWSSNVT